MSEEESEEYLMGYNITDQTGSSSWKSRGLAHKRSILHQVRTNLADREIEVEIEIE